MNPPSDISSAAAAAAATPAAVHAPAPSSPPSSSAHSPPLPLHHHPLHHFQQHQQHPQPASSSALSQPPQLHPQHHHHQHPQQHQEQQQQQHQQHQQQQKQNQQQRHHPQQQQQRQQFYPPPLYSQPPYPLSAFPPYPPHYFQPPVFPVQPAWQSYGPSSYYPWAPPITRDPSPNRPRRRAPSHSRRPSTLRSRDPHEDDQVSLSFPPISSTAATKSNPATPNPIPTPGNLAQPHDAPPSHRRPSRARRAADRREQAHHSHAPSGAQTQSHNPSKLPEHDPAAELDAAARHAVSTADGVTLTLLLTSWANSLEEASQASPSSSHFETVFHASRALEIVVGDVLLSTPAPAIRNALVALLGRVCYADKTVHDSLAEALNRLNIPLQTCDVRMRDLCLADRQRALRGILAFLRDLQANIDAFVTVLPTTDDDPPSPHSPAPGAAANSPRTPPTPSAAAVANATANAATNSPVGTTKASSTVGPAGPDPTKAVERSMDAWRRAVARLQGEMAIIVVLSDAQQTIDSEFSLPPDVSFYELHEFYDAIRASVRAYISEDLAARRLALAQVFWPTVLQGADSTVFSAAKSRAALWVSQFETARRDVESQLDDAGIGFGPPARVSDDKFSVLVSASAGVAALVSCHQHSFTWASNTARLLSSMVTAFRCLERVASGELRPSESLRSTFFRGLDVAFAAIDDVVNWSFSSLHGKVFGSLEKSCVSSDRQVGDTNPRRVRHLRFEEPPKTPSKDNANTPAGQSRRKPRHARMKSSPDALLHLNANFEDYSDEVADSDRTVVREIESAFDKETDKESEQITMTNAKTGTTFYSNANEGDSGIARDGSSGRTGGQNENSGKRGDDELPVVYEGEPLEYGDEEEDDDDRDIIVHEDVDDGDGDAAKTPKKVNHTSHIRSMSVDGIPF